MAPTDVHPLTSVLLHARQVVDECLPDPDGPREDDPRTITPGLLEHLSPVLFAVVSTGRSTSGQDVQGHAADLWHIVCRVWNFCINRHSEKPDKSLANLRQFVSDLISLFRDPDVTPQDREIAATIYHQTGCEHARLEEHEAAEACFAKATEHRSHVCSMLDGLGLTTEQQSDFVVAYFRLFVDRAQNAWHLQQKSLAADLLSTAGEVAQHPALSSGLMRFHLCQTLAYAYFYQGRDWLAEKDGDALGLLKHAHELVTGHLVPELDKGDAAPGYPDIREKTSDLHAQVLGLLAQAYLLTKQPAPALQCMQAMQQLDKAEDTQPALHLIAIQANIMLGQFDNAGSELLQLAAHADASLGCCIEGLAALLGSQSAPMETLKTAVGLMLERFPEDTELPIRLVELIFGQKDEDNVRKEDEDFVLDIVGQEGVVDMLTQDTMAAKEHRKLMYTLLCNRGTHDFIAKAYSACTQLYAAALMYAGPPAKATLARQLSLAYMGARNLDRALEYAEMAQTAEPSSAYNVFIKIKVLLMKSNAPAASEELPKLLAAEDFTLDLLRVLAVEAVSAQVVSVAKEALEQLHRRMCMQQATQEDAKPGDEANVLRTLIKLTTDSAPNWHAVTGVITAQGKADADHEPTAPPPVHGALCALYSLAVERLEALGSAQFFGDDGDAQAQWFAGSAYNAGLKAGLQEDCPSAAVLYGASATISGAHPHPTAHSLTNQKVAYMLGASCTLAHHEAHPEHVQSLSLAKHMLAKAREADAALAQLPKTGSMTEQAAASHDKGFRENMLMLELGVAVRLGDEAAQLEAVNACAKEPAITAEHLLHMAHFCAYHSGSAGHGARPAQKLLLDAALRMLMANRHDRNYAAIAQTLRQLVDLSSDAEKLALLRDVAGLAAAAPSGGIPPSEATWLAITAWNRGCHHARFCRPAEARAFMEVALALLPACPDLQQQHGETMVERVKGLLQKPATEPSAVKPMTC